MPSTSTSFACRSIRIACRFAPAAPREASIAYAAILPFFARMDAAMMFKIDRRAAILAAWDQLVRRVPAQLKQRRDLRVVPDAKRVEEARHAADHDVAGQGADWP